MPTNSKGRGVLPVTAAQTRKPQKQTPQPQQPRPPAPKLRMVVRRLPPGLTETEFWEAIGSEWKLGGGKVDWAAFRPGKISKDLAKPSRPARAYLKVKDQAQIESLSIHVRATTFHDAKNTVRDSCLVGPPTLEFAPYPKIPSTRTRHDGRQGTIDQDAEFIDFLQSLTEPITKPAAEDSSENKNEKVTITPLVQFIKEKKASKAKEKEAAAASAKSTKKAAETKDVHDAKEVKDTKNAKHATPSKSEQTIVVKKGAQQTEVEKARVAKATQQAMDSIKKSVAEIKGQSTPSKESKTAEKKDSTPTQSTPRKERQRGDASAAARIIGRDLGLVPKEGRTPRGQRAVTTPAQSTTPTPPTAPAAARTPPQTPIPTAPAAAQTPTKQNAQPPTGPRNLRNQNAAPSPLRATQTPPAPKGKPSPQLSNGAKSAFLKHANPSQGVTEELLRSTFSVHGNITRCEIDKKKGLGYIDFTDTEGLRKAIAASPVKVGNGSVVVLENRTPYKKVSHGSAKSETASPAVSIPSSPRIIQSNLATIAERTVTPPVSTTPQPPAAAVVPPLPLSDTNQTGVKASEVVASSDVQMSATQESSETITGVPEGSTPTSPSAATPPSAPRGGRGNHRGHYRGRGYRGRGQGRGGNRAASTPNPTSGAPPNAQNTPPAAGGTKT